MIEQGHLDAMRVAQKRAEQAVISGNTEAGIVAAQQIIAILRIQAEARVILKEMNLSDIEPMSDMRELSPALNLVPTNRLVAVFRTIEGISSKDFAGKIGVDPSYLSRIETGERRISLDTIHRIIKAFEWEESDWRTKLLMKKIDQETKEKLSKKK